MDLAENELIELSDDDLEKVSGGERQSYAFCESCEQLVNVVYVNNVGKCQKCNGTNLFFKGEF